MNTQQEPQCKQRRVTYLLTYIMSKKGGGEVVGNILKKKKGSNIPVQNVSNNTYVMLANTYAILTNTYAMLNNTYDTLTNTNVMLTNTCYTSQHMLC